MTLMVQTTAIDTPLRLLGGLTPREFLRDYWQKKPLVVRNAVAGMETGLIDLPQLLALAQQDDMISRLICYQAGKKQPWHLAHGPFRPKVLRELPAQDWTILVQNLNHALPSAAELLYQFNFIPYSRLDDLMVSYAPTGGTVGAHIDSYDVFLLQAIAPKRWQISAQDDLTWVEDAPLRLLKNFQATETFVLEAGDMLYLPPRYAHYGVALGAGMTYSIGFRAANTQELGSEFLGFMQDNLCVNADFSDMHYYQDPDLAPQTAPAEIDASMIAKVSAILAKAVWSEHEVGAFLGGYLSTPKPHVLFEPPFKPLSFDAFVQQVETKGIGLDLKSQMLFVADCFFLNGEAVDASADDAMGLRLLANTRRLPAGQYGDDLMEWLYEAYCAGYLRC